MEPQDGSPESWQNIGKSVGELQWAHHTLVYLVEVVQLNGLVSERLKECVVQLTRSAVLLEGLIQEHLAHVRRRRDD